MRDYRVRWGNVGLTVALLAAVVLVGKEVTHHRQPQPDHLPSPPTSGEFTPDPP